MTPPDRARWRDAVVRWQAAQAFFAEATGPWVDVAIAELQAAAAVLAALAHERDPAGGTGASGDPVQPPAADSAG